MKIVATVTNCADAAHIGGNPESNSCIIDIENIPPLIQKYLKNKKWAEGGTNRYTYESISFSLLDESE